jgi:S-adenosylmethionine/arginine decarboxylase-like enzyme
MARKKYAHNHLMINAETAFPITNKRQLRKFLKGTAEVIGVHRLGGTRVRYSRRAGARGLIGSLMLDTSHISIHIFDEPVPAHIRIDVYTSGSLDVELTILKIVNDLKIDDIQWLHYNRTSGFNLRAEGSMLADVLES